MKKPSVRFAIALCLLVQVLGLTPQMAPTDQITFAANETTQCITTTPIAPPRTFPVIPGQAQRLLHDEAVLDIGADALAVATAIGITPLRHDSIATPDLAMTNVTKGPRCSYRFTPHPMRFNRPIQVTLPYNRSLIPPGLTEQDVKTFYFDDQTGSWKELERVTVDTQRKVVVSLTDHFTDMINATITVPDHPSPLSLNPTSMKDIKSADPSAGINLIEAPQANNMGDANLAYPIEVAPGRGGMQPQLSINYNSASSNGWLGVGWDLPIQSVTIDTRWGVPRYDATNETETYLLNGEQLTPVFHRGQLQPRASERVFHTRVEGQFHKIVRHGSSPSNYWWEVVDKSGMSYFYGGIADIGPDAASRLDDGAGKVFTWVLKEARDLNGNNMRYEYDRVSGGGGANGEPWRQIYLKSIRYTGSNGAAGPYQVVFNREPGRPDSIVDGRPGFKTVLDQRLASVEVRLLSDPNPVIRKYVLQYETGQFQKSRLVRVIQYGEGGVTEFNRHSFEYYDEVASSTQGVLDNFRQIPDFGDATVLSGQGTLIGGEDSSAFGATESSGEQVHFYAGIGQGPTKEASAGFKVGSEIGESITNLALVDLNGDGLPDQVFKQSGHFYYRPNTGGPNSSPNFGPQVQLDSLEQVADELNRDNSATFTLGAEIFFGTGAVSLDKSWTQTTGSVYVNDVNGDLLPDIIANRMVFYNKLVDGVPTFGASSPTPLEGGNSITSGMLHPPSAELQAEMQRRFHLVDPIRRWVAPYSGTLTIAGAVRLLQGPHPSYTTADGVRVSIQRNGTEIWNLTINESDLSPHEISGLNSVAVNRGDRIYFRVNSLNDGSYDAVEFDPTLSYNGKSATLPDENGMPIFVYNAASDYSYGGRPLTTTLPITGTAALTGNLVKDSVTSDDVKVLVFKNTALVGSHTVAWNQTGTFPINIPITVAANDQVTVRLGVDSRINLAKVHLSPQIAYDTVEGRPAPRDPSGNLVFKFTPPVTAQIYPELGSSSPYSPYVVPSNAAYMTVTQNVSVVPATPLTFTTNVNLAVKRDTERLAKQLVTIRDGSITGPSTLTASMPVTAGQQIYFTVDSTAYETLDVMTADLLNVSQPQVVIQTITGTVLPLVLVNYDLHVGLPEAEAFGGGFRGWYLGQYNGHEPTSPIDESLLRLPQDESDDVAEYFLQMIPFVDQDHWRTEDEECWISGPEMSSSRLKLNYLDFGDGSSLGGGGRGIARHSGGENRAAGLSLTSFGAGLSEGSTWSDIDFLDFNGDHYPDVVGAGKVQRTLPNGALEQSHTAVGGFDTVRESESDSFNINLGATTSRPIVDSEGELVGLTSEQAAYNIGVGGNANRGDFTTLSDLVDINGDGLPDYVRKGTSSLEVRLNLGDRFGAVEHWAGSGTVRFEKSTSVGVSANVGATLPSYSFGGGFAHTLSTAGTQQDLIDVNGDGLADIVTKSLDDLIRSPGTTLSVRFNMGNSFTEPYTLNGAMGRPIRANSTVSRNLGAHFTVSIWIPFTPNFVILNPGYNHNESLGGLSVMLSDLDGDGYPDHIYSDTDGNVQVRLNNHGKTNLLKTVRRPLGGRIDLDYERSGNTTDQPSNRWVLSKVATFDGHPGDGETPPTSPTTLLTTYSYGGGKYDRAEREFYGYETVTVIQYEDPGQGNSPYRKVVRTQLNSTFYNKGLLTREVILDSLNRKFLETINEYDVVTVVPGGGPAELEDFTATRFPQLTRTEQRFYEGNPTPGKSTYSTYQYDALGNVIHTFDARDTGAADDITAAITYSACPATYLVGARTSIQVTGNGTLMRRREATIDCNTGNMTQVRQYLADGTPIATDLNYFPNGSLQRVIEPPNEQGERYATEYAYDGVVNTHVTEIRDSFGYESTAEHNYKYGLVNRTTDLNNNRTTYEYDSFGRMLKVTGPYEQGGSSPTIRFEYHHDAVVPWALTRHYDPFRSQTDTIDTVVFVDGFKRVLQTKKDATVFAGPESNPQDVMIVTGRLTFDFMGRTVREFYPVTEPLGTAGVFNASYDSVAPTALTYDILDRNTRITIPDGTFTTFAYGFGTDRSGATQFETRATDANGIEKKIYLDIRQLMTAVKESHTPPGGPAEVLWTSYTYDPVDQLIEIKDAESNVTTIAYDNLGRRTSTNNPDTGLVEMVYDRASNLIAKITPNLRAQGTQTQYDYEFNRLSAISYPNFPETSISYTYGGPGASFNRAGRITLVRDESGSDERFYGKLGEVVKEIKTVSSDTFVREPYTTQYQYDTLGRLQRLTYPDGEVLTYRYDSGGMVRAATGQRAQFTYNYLVRSEYDKFEARAFVQTGNNVRTQYTYRPDNRRLQNLKAGVDGDIRFQNLNYNYDNVGNILELQNDVPVPPPSRFGGPSLQTYTYDDLYRLTGAAGSYRFAPDKTRRYALSMSYSNIHNVLSKVQHDEITQTSGQSIPQHKTTYNYSYDYQGSQPHAPTHIGDLTYTYDANGNQNGWNNDTNGQRRDILWDDENRIQSIFDNGHEKTYKYNDQGERVIKRGPQGETAYVNPFFTMRNGQIVTKHVFVGTMRLASKLGRRSDQTQERQIYFYHPDHLGSSNYVTDLTGQLYEHLEYFPFGESWVQENSNTQRTPYLFTSKELDEETDLQYFGARYYDPRTSVWQSAEPLLPTRPETGMTRPKFYSAYSYAGQNPVAYLDPDGRDDKPAPALRVLLIEKGENKIPPEVKPLIARRVQSVLNAVAKQSTNATVKKGFTVEYNKEPTSDKDQVVYLIKAKDTKLIRELAMKHLGAGATKGNAIKEAEDAVGKGFGANVPLGDKSVSFVAVSQLEALGPWEDDQEKGYDIDGAGIDFGTFVLHELGHGFGLHRGGKHADTGIMSAHIPFKFSDPDPDFGSGEKAQLVKAFEKLTK